MEVKIINIPVSELEGIIKKAVADVMAGQRMVITNNTREEQELIGTEEACRILGCSPRTMQRYRDRKCFSVIKRGPHKALYYRHEIEDFRDANRIEAR